MVRYGLKYNVISYGHQDHLVVLHRVDKLVVAALQQILTNAQELQANKNKAQPHSGSLS